MYALSSCQIVSIDEENVLVKGDCVVTKKPYEVKTKLENFTNYMAGEFIQDAFPDLDADDREFLLSGISPEGWIETFGDCDED